jgi:exodeoxyribonuclease V beta subunit
LHGSRLIEASAGTGKTWTIAALYLRLVLGAWRQQCIRAAFATSRNSGDDIYRAATRELSDRIRSRLIEAARVFRGDESCDPVSERLAPGI